MKNKKGLELSINFIVITIFSVVILFFGITLAKNMFSEAQEFKAQVDANTQREIEALLSGGARVAIPLNKAELKSGESESFGLGVLNTLGTSPTYGNYKFFVYVTESTSNPSSYLQTLPNIGQPRSISVENNEKVTMPIGVKVYGNAPSGTYIVNVEVCYEDWDRFAPPSDNSEPGDCSANPYQMYYKYGSPQKIYITVP